MQISDFVNKELILFSMADNIRSIPSVADGLKPGQRKVMFACFKRNMKLGDDVKVAQLGGYIGEQTQYHHGEASLYSTITGLAQNYVGSNNINLLEPNGQFGTRIAVSACVTDLSLELNNSRVVRTRLVLVISSRACPRSPGRSSIRMMTVCSPI